MPPRLALTLCAVLAASTSLLMAGRASAAGPRTFAIPERPMAAALAQFSIVTGEQVIVDPALLKGLAARPVAGAMSNDAALARMLDGSGLHAERTSRGVLMIRPELPALAPLSPAAPEPAPLLAEVVVTTQKWRQRTLEVPLALTTFSGADLERMGAAGMEDVARFTPGLTVAAASPASAGFSMRGITQASGDATREPRLSIFQDGAPASKERGAYFELLDLERIEVAKGPQSTLFGRSAMTGAINIVQNKARPAIAESLLKVELGDHGLRTAEAMVNLPMGDQAGVRIAARSRRRDGLVDNLLGGPAQQSVATDAARISVHMRPSRNATADLIINYQHDRPTGAGAKSLVYAPADPANGESLGDLGRYSPAALAALDGDGASRRLGLDRTLASAAVLIDVGLSDETRLSAVLSHRRFAADERQDADGLALPIISLFEETRGVETNYELRLEHDPGGSWRGFVGLNAFREHGTQLVPIVIDERYELARIAGGLTAPNPQAMAVLTDPAFLMGQLRSLACRRGHELGLATVEGIAANLKSAHLEQNQNFGETTSYDVFADLTVRPAARWEFSAGLRLSMDTKTSAAAPATPRGASVLRGALAALSMAEPERSALLSRLSAPGAGARGQPDLPSYGLIIQPTAGNGKKVSREHDDVGASWRLAARYAPSSELSIYGAYARGRRPTVLVAGGPLVPYGPARFAVVPAETVDSFEVGAKVNPAGGSLRFDGALYAYAYKNFQTTELVGGQLRTANAGRAAAYGLEAQLEWAPSDNLALAMTYAYGHARLTSGALSGNRFRLAPDHKLSVQLDLSRDLGHGRISFRPSYAWQSMMFFSDDNDRADLSRGLARDTVQDEWQGPYGLLDLRLSYEHARSDWSLTIFVKNALDADYVQEAGFIGESFGFSASSAGPPRTAGVSLVLRR